MLLFQCRYLTINKALLLLCICQLLLCSCQFFLHIVQKEVLIHWMNLTQVPIIFLTRCRVLLIDLPHILLIDVLQMQYLCLNFSIFCLYAFILFIQPFKFLVQLLHLFEQIALVLENSWLNLLYLCRWLLKRKTLDLEIRISGVLGHIHLRLLVH